MGTTRFKLFSSTGPSVAIGLALTLAATLTLTPALLVLLARLRPRAFAGLTAPSSGFWERSAARSWPGRSLSWCATLLVMAPLAVLGLRTTIVQDIITELPAGEPVRPSTLRLLADEVRPGIAHPADRGARLGRRPPPVGGAGPDRRREPVPRAPAPAGRGPVGDAAAGEPEAARARPGSPRGWARSTTASPGWPTGPVSSRRGSTEGVVKLRAALLAGAEDRPAPDRPPPRRTPSRQARRRPARRSRSGLRQRLARAARDRPRRRRRSAGPRRHPLQARPRPPIPARPTTRARRCSAS